MTYATQQDLIDAYGEDRLIALTDIGTVPTGVVDAAKVMAALESAKAKIDGYLAGRYVLPLATVPDLVRDLARDIAWWDLHPYEPDAKTVRAYDDALRMLRDLSSGALRLDVAGVEPDTTDAGGVVVTDRERPFTEDKLKGWI